VRGGYTEDKNRLAVLELLEACAAFVDDPVSRNPTEEIGASLPLVRMEAWRRGYVFIPDLHLARCSRTHRGCSTARTPRCASRRSSTT